ncbi:MAG: LptF/LptG family permease [Chlamydiales bacterium]|nr:LptF/LptG family permease [Chlamydiales bacterium]
MPLFWRYLLRHYLKVLALSVISFIAILLVSRMEEIAHFASMGAPLNYLALFTLYQIPYILPIAIPISCLLSAMILFQRLSHTHELTALRAGGFSLKQVTGPILLAGALFSLANFYIASELATSSHLTTRKMAYDLTSENPLLLLQSAKIAKLKGSYLQMGPVRSGRSVKNLLIALKNGSNERVSLCLVKKIALEEGDLKGEGVSIISTAPAQKGEHLFIENQTGLTSEAKECAGLLQKKGWKIANDHLKISLLRVRTQSLREVGGMKLAKCYSEFVRRVSLGIAAFTFTLMGLSFGMEISRSRTKRGILSVLLLTAMTLITFFVGKQLDHLFWIASALFLLPHGLITAASILTLSRINKGIE